MKLEAAKQESMSNSVRASESYESERSVLRDEATCMTTARQEATRKAPEIGRGKEQITHYSPHLFRRERYRAEKTEKSIRYESQFTVALQKHLRIANRLAFVILTPEGCGSRMAVIALSLNEKELNIQ